MNILDAYMVYTFSQSLIQESSSALSSNPATDISPLISMHMVYALPQVNFRAHRERSHNKSV
jgi:hypothetical protein